MYVCDCVVGRKDGRDEEADVRVVTVWECGGRTLEEEGDVRL